MPAICRLERLRCCALPLTRATTPPHLHSVAAAPLPATATVCRRLRLRFPTLPRLHQRRARSGDFSSSNNRSRLTPTRAAAAVQWQVRQACNGMRHLHSTAATRTTTTVCSTTKTLRAVNSSPSETQRLPFQTAAEAVKSMPLPTLPPPTLPPRSTLV